ncbi:type IV toxin-antitoxin system AbiEi family antitoxin domain-containing protein [Mitsuaria sp. GD03876]|uniref:type IV toxin-antitoxin system AbiEi family antitoxin domain-containing protein n=1 Tax=Mitsuaria sp. GD03876 TaxID=2975399 RepID=UPI00244AD109|nr:type IV toxin-antitoxin system AbiEi family antitoxin domain-containing protein [Mitsuaria sp. GD03876]MDH0865942.1 type IV toxin-antitoxin system AbiEi family antitoxin domain-containing protein [Mitsuaria sp. GD03876]
MPRRPPPPPSHEEAVLALARRRSLLRAREVVEEGIPSMVLSRMVRADKLERVSHGLYALPDRDHSEHVSLAEVCARVPNAVVCLMSALRFHEIGSQQPFEVWIALPSNAPTPRIAAPSIRITRMSEKAFAEGVVAHDIDGVNVPVFSVAKTIADCFKFRSKVGLDVGIEALKDGWMQKAFTADDLWHCALVDRVGNVMRPYMESLIA